MSFPEIIWAESFSQVLSLHGCNNVDSDLVKRLNDEKWHIPDLTLPSTPSSHKQGVEVDPEYLR